MTNIKNTVINTLIGLVIFAVGGAIGGMIGYELKKPEPRREIKIVVVPRKYEKLDGRRLLVYDFERINLDSLLTNHSQRDNE